MDLLRMLLQATLVAGMAAPTNAQAKQGCEDRCGNVSIPYPFGTREGCYYDKAFLITCNDVFNPSKPFLQTSNIEITNISLLDGQVQILQFIARDCDDKWGSRTKFAVPTIELFKFRISRTKNKFTAIGCDTRASIIGKKDDMNYLSGCMTVCRSQDYVTNGSCSGIGCCQTSIPEGVESYSVQLDSYNNHTNVWNFSPCSYAFVVEEDKFNFSSTFLTDLDNVEKLPVVLDWAVGVETSCEDARKSSGYACQNHSKCSEVDFGPGYRCNCLEGYDGNPYHPDGCQDIDECSDPTLNECENNCENIDGNYTCSCPKWFHGDGRKDGNGCNPELQLVIKLVLGIGMGILVLTMGCSSLYWAIRRRNLIRLKGKFFEQNGGLILQEQLSKLDGSVQKPKIFTIEELKEATNDFDKERIVGQGGFGTVYEGVLPQNKRVAIKKSLAVDKSQQKQFFNEFIVLSQINHENVVKLLGCCLHAESPFLVYEFITNGNLSRHIHEGGDISWETRLRVAKETAKALSDLHTKASIPIIHRDVKSTNILLDDNFTAKISDFGVARIVPLDKTQVQTMVQGTLGYFDPEYFYTNKLSDKSDVYSFGVVLAELLTGRKAISVDKPEESLLSTYFISSMKKKCLSSILDVRIVNEGNTMQVDKVANIAQRCLSLEGDERPNMTEVATKLEELLGVEKHLSIRNPQEIDHLQGI
ncbi:wall-associated receptor kinase 2-like [Cornus florida]|uniref:wall-associated receptor kinase 2-like n=1 Tax=Cornus florida TaxID=4283 RepID=UPI0028A0EE33|nr:wall-associated receptor kinase 2-like [Cornus florida]